ncbi:MAG: SRPBCC family protein [Nocardioides sp.]
MELTHKESIVVDATPAALYDLVTDIERTGEWSPVCVGCSWDEGDGPREGAWFTGRNRLGERSWETRSVVVAAEPGREFAWQVGGSFVRWGYTFAPSAVGTEVTETWEFLPDGLAFFREKFGADGEAEIASRAEQAHAGIPATLAAIKRVAEAR